jgi:5-(carboxyamino)imidazole ribonucleotide synthase
METTQREGICRWVTAPAGCDPGVARRATALAERIAALTQASGVVCVEMFEAASGLLVNELAMRPHNSGHLTLDAFATSQFENHLRAILDWPLGSAAAIVPAAAMVNVLGPPDGSDPAARLDLALEVPGARVRLYGKQARPGRKLGHVTALAETADEALSRARESALVLSDA